MIKDKSQKTPNSSTKKSNKTTSKKRTPKSLKSKLKFIEKIQNIPAMPIIILNIIAKLNDPKINFKEIEDLISLDPALVSYILRIINSPFYNMRSEVLTIPRALSLLGSSNLKTLLIGYGIHSIYSNLEDKKIQTILWEHSVSVGILANLISENVFKVVHSEAYVCGLLHDIGKIVLYMHNPFKFKKSIKLESRQNNSVDSEYSVFGFSHIETGYFLLTKFGFLRNMKNIVLYHHNPEFSSDNDYMVWIIGLANELSYYIKDDKRNNIDNYLNKLNISENQILQILEKAKTQIESQLSKL